jgi:eukaryotic-like serine/threonine-protein kinase
LLPRLAGESPTLEGITVLRPQQIFAGRYRVIRHLADGGMGAVYEAEHTATEARVALKLLWPHIVQLASARERFELEARIAARVNDDHIVKMLDAGFDPDTRAPFLVMELLNGRTLAALVEAEGRLSATTTIALMGQVAEGLDAAHGYRTAAGEPHPIVHRDLKPENLFVTYRSDGVPWLKILDFGIAKVLSDATAVSREVRGTPLYMAYEQAAGEPVSPQTDVWAFGLITYFLLTGRRYWPAANRENASLPALFAEILSLPLQAPSERLRQDGIPLELPRAFDPWLLRCLHRDPTQRFASAGQARVALERALAGAEPTRRPDAELLQPPRHARQGAAVTTPARMATATYSAAPAGALLGASQSLPPVASERPRVAPRWNHRPPALAGLAALTIFGVAVLFAWAWQATDSGPPLGEAPQAAVAEPPEPGLPPAPPPAQPAQRPASTPPPSVRVTPVDTVTLSLQQEPAPHDLAKKPPPAKVSAPPPLDGPARTAPKRPAPPCQFDPYTGRCIAQAPQGPRD